MPFTDKPQVFGASINALSFGPAGKEVTIGGSNVYPLYAFDAPLANPVKVGIQVSDKGFDATVPGLAKFYEGCTTVDEEFLQLLVEGLVALACCKRVDLIVSGSDGFVGSGSHLFGSSGISLRFLCVSLELSSN